MLSPLTQRPGSLVICALETYSKIGGIQNFNRRVFQNLAQRAMGRGEHSSLAIQRGDQNAQLPTIQGLEIAAPKCKICFYLRAGWEGSPRLIFLSSAMSISPSCSFGQGYAPQTADTSLRSHEVWHIRSQWNVEFAGHHVGRKLADCSDPRQRPDEPRLIEALFP